MHVAIIPDGMRRWAMSANETYENAYLVMAQKLQSYTVELFQSGAEIISLFLSSKQNFNRNKKEVHAFCNAENLLCSKLIPEIVDTFSTRVFSVGNMNILPNYLRKSSKLLEKNTNLNVATKLYLCFAYDPLDELHFAYTRNKINNSRPLEHFWVSDFVDILIRTGRGSKASSFLPLQCAGHAKVYSIDKLFLDTGRDDIIGIVKAYKNAELFVESVDDIKLSKQ